MKLFLICTLLLVTASQSYNVEVFHHLKKIELKTKNWQTLSFCGKYDCPLFYIKHHAPEYESKCYKQTTWITATIAANTEKDQNLSKDYYLLY